MIGFNLFGSGGFKLNRGKIRKALTSASKILKIKKNYNLSIVLVDNKTIKSLNKRYRQKNRITDVLAFTYKEGNKFKNQKFPSHFIEKNYLGDIIISYPQLLKQAKEHKQSSQDEFNLLLVHGLLHLFGYDHYRKKDREKMLRLEGKILRITNDC